MRRMYRPLFILITVCLVMLCACGTKYPNVPRDVTDFVEEVNRVMMTDGAAAAVKYMHFEDSNGYSAKEKYEMFKISGNQWKEYHIQSIEKLNDGLYAVHITGSDAGGLPKEIDCYNFVGIQNGQMIYMNSIDHIPAELSAGVDLEAYHSKNID